jgi:hypothetical protein
MPGTRTPPEIVAAQHGALGAREEALAAFIGQELERWGFEVWDRGGAGELWVNAGHRSFKVDIAELNLETAATIRREAMGGEHVTSDLPANLAAVLRDQSVIVPQDAAVFELIAAWRKAPAAAASAAITTAPETGLVDALNRQSKVASSTAPGGCF